MLLCFCFASNHTISYPHAPIVAIPRCPFRLLDRCHPSTPYSLLQCISPAFVLYLLFSRNRTTILLSFSPLASSSIYCTTNQISSTILKCKKESKHISCKQVGLSQELWDRLTQQGLYKQTAKKELICHLMRSQGLSVADLKSHLSCQLQLPSHFLWSRIPGCWSPCSSRCQCCLSFVYASARSQCFNSFRVPLS